MKIDFLYITGCSYCLRTEKDLRQALKELKLKEGISKVLIDSASKAKKYKFAGSPTVRLNGKDIQEKIVKERCLPCEEISKKEKTTKFVEKECNCGCRTYSYKGKQYPYPPKEMIKKAIQNELKK